MLKLIRLELRKNKISLFKGFLIADLALLLFMLLVVFTEVEEGDFSTYADVFEGVHIFVKAVFMVFGSVLISKLVIEEYKNNTIDLLFMYPIPRKKLMAAKLIIVSLFILITIFVSNVVVGAGIVGFNHYFSEAISGELTPQIIGEQLIMAASDAVYSAGIGLIPLFFGMRKKSLPATIVSGVLIAGLLSSDFGSFRLGNQVGVSLFLGLAGVAIAYLSIRKIETQDVG
ncbi:MULTISPECIES: ABC transporter permease [unclassified Paenibacillus]|uniref:ABC transporter permease n=1 Tax=unclassified Paenibacillus TaxID=185978 RepID=UPI002406DC7D|nr:MULTISPECIES: ABC transporter permease [unclassified Paenibacillus]MDF9841790.1 ABC-type transport system involved in multi-copper enzyme maturation permease subunit [Paenibacillus sp. PastF-2]MDF9848529.1 ABC-type transport system involved in multi-copper enzyme maturation permease subunit [Paenibacillus sp. PastM-2]MDF9854950.1 ABC-type transport system involved in multi-copper enzyme maturation permease subunit [Paenibacillus sp. PastF-1]MDH6480219.1 ABC-type transport system involved in 